MDQDFNPDEAMQSLTGGTTERAGSAVFPKYQWSIFAGESGKEQFVVRDNDMNSFQIAVKAIRANLQAKAVVAQTQAPKFDGLDSTCSVHGVQMLQAISKKTNNPYWYHDGDGGRCFGKGFQPSR